MIFRNPKAHDLAQLIWGQWGKEYKIGCEQTRSMAMHLNRSDLIKLVDEAEIIVAAWANKVVFDIPSDALKRDSLVKIGRPKKSEQRDDSFDLCECSHLKKHHSRDGTMCFSNPCNCNGFKRRGISDEEKVSGESRVVLEQGQG